MGHVGIYIIYKRSWYLTMFEFEYDYRDLIIHSQFGNEKKLFMLCICFIDFRNFAEEPDNSESNLCTMNSCVLSDRPAMELAESVSGLTEIGRGTAHIQTLIIFHIHLHNSNLLHYPIRLELLSI